MTLRLKTSIGVGTTLVALLGTLYAALHPSMLYLAFVFLAIGVVFSVLPLVLLERSVIARLARLSHGVKGITAAGNATLRLDTTGTDEFAGLGQAIDSMLDAIERAESPRRRAEQDLRSIFDNVHDAILIHDLSGNIIEVNDRMLALYGVSREEACTLSIEKDCSSPDQPSGQFAEIWKSVIEGRIRQFEWIARRPRDGTTFPVEVSLGKIPLEGREVILATVRDITERKVAEQNLRQSEEQLHLALSGTDLGVWDWNIQTGEMQFDERWTGMLGYSPEEIEPHVHSWQNRIHPDDAQRVADALRTHLEGQTSVYEAEHRLKASSGDWIWVHARGRVVVRSRSGKPLRMTGTQLDITCRKKTEAELQKTRNAADQTKSGFPANMSHTS